MEKMLKVLHFEDPNDDNVFWDFVVFSEKSCHEIQKISEAIVKEFEEQGFEDWTYEDIYAELKKRGVIEEPEFKVDWCTLYI